VPVWVGGTESLARRYGAVLTTNSSSVVCKASSLGSVDLIDQRPGVRSGKPCFVGTRIAVYDVLDYLAAGMTAHDIVADFPELTEDHVRAALEFAALRERRLATPA